MGKIIAIVNQKGGVGKTTSAVNLAAALGGLDRTVLLVDIDPQGNATSGFGVNKRALQSSSYDVLIGGSPARAAVLRTQFTGVYLLPSTMTLAGAELELVDIERREARLKDALAPIRDVFDYILLDCPPSLGLLTLNGLVAADTYLVPIQCEFYALEGLSQLTNTVRKAKQAYNSLLDIEGVLLTMYDSRLNLTGQVVEEIKKYFPRKVYASVIPRNVRLSEAPSFGQPVMYYDPASRGSEAYNAFAREFLSLQH
ncbi:MAG: ParA family protein [Oscillospiraceae bacterium]|jgi:chromosome partitioning protein|nr:ParA family protein [Oscillospiraceae bacterium]